ncbi:MAG: DUF333 domain-containing protein [Acidimicrobiia bacterium]|nr:DUF333 domain-containing protein [Acidimicrobiia bacterium]
MWCGVVMACTDDDSAERERESQLPNPASAYCEEQGGEVDIVTDEDGSESGVCVLPDGTRVDEWEFYGSANR